MGLLHHLALVTALAAPSGAADTLPAYADAATRALVERARSRRREQDAAVTDYHATLRYRLTLSFGRRRWARMPPAAVEEQVADVRWRRVNDLRVDIRGRRAVSRAEGLELSTVFDRPWFVPRDADDSLRIVGSDFPAGGALHPLAPGADAWYRYAILDSVVVDRPSGPSLTLVRVEVVPRRAGRPLVAGRLWLDRSTAEVVRLAFKYVGPVAWIAPETPTRSDSSESRRTNRMLNRFFGLELDLEYAIQDGRYWLPYRQTISGRVQVPFGGGLTVPFEAVSAFENYAVNTGEPIAFAVPLPDTTLSAAERRKARRDSLRGEWERDGKRTWGGRDSSWNAAGRWAGGRYEIHRPSNDSLSRFTGWTDTLTLAARTDDVERVRAVAADLERLAAALPDSITELQSHGFGYERLDDAVRFNRVQGYSLGLGYRISTDAFSSLYGTARYGFGDERVTGRLAWVRDAPAGRITIAAYRDVVSVDPFATGRGIGAQLDAVFAAHDYADYTLATGGGVTVETSVATGLDLVASARVEQMKTVDTTSRSKVNAWFGGSGLIGPNAPVDEGTFGGASLSLRRLLGVRWSLTADALTGAGTTTGRLYADARADVGRTMGLTVRAKAGIATAPTLQQMTYRLGGPNTLRGYPYAVARGRSFWSAQLDVPLAPSFLRPVAFLDVGSASASANPFERKMLAGAGVGLSLYSRRFHFNALRLDFSQPISAGFGDRWRFDLTVGAVR